MTYLEAYTSCANLFLDNWTQTPVEQEGLKLQVNELDEFARLQIFNDDSSNFSHAKNPGRLLTGHAIVELYVRRGTGPGRLIALTDECAAIFSNVKLSNGLKFYSAQVVDHGSSISGETVTDPNWIAKSIIAKFLAPL